MRPLTPEDMTRIFSEAFNRGDLEAVVDLYEPEAVLARSSGPAIVGREAIRHAYTAYLSTRPRMDVAARAIIKTGDLALCYGEWTMRGTNADGTPRAVSGKAVEVLRRQPDGTWRFVLDDPFSTGVA
ncbi:MAG: DUF4440 domain-containing protein [Candidatus Rokubacteria bacterium]|nr:DUF4440 domain-containing protein [Candidatus Rokubacteria bacterium]